MILLTLLENQIKNELNSLNPNYIKIDTLKHRYNNEFERININKLNGDYRNQLQSPVNILNAYSIMKRNKEKGFKCLKKMIQNSEPMIFYNEKYSDDYFSHITRPIYISDTAYTQLTELNLLTELINIEIIDLKIKETNGTLEKNLDEDINKLKELVNKSLTFWK